MRRLLCALACAACATGQMPPPAKLSVPGAAPAPAAPATPSARLDGLARRYWQTLLETAPVTLVFDGGAGGPLFATALGDHRFDSRLDDWSPAARRRLRDALSQLRSEAAIFDAKALSGEDAITLEILRQQLAEELSVEACEGELWVVDQMNGPQTQLPQTWMYYPLGTEKGVADLVSRYGQVERMFGQIVANLRRGLFQSKVSPRVNVQRVIDSLDALVAKEAASSPMLPPAERFAGHPDPAGARERVRSAIDSSVLPGLRTYREFLSREVLPRARTDVGLWAIPGGDSCYASLIAHHTGAKRAPQEVHDLGLRMLASIEEEMESIASGRGEKHGDELPGQAPSPDASRTGQPSSPDASRAGQAASPGASRATQPARPEDSLSVPADVEKYRERLGHRADQFKRTPKELLAWNQATLLRATAALPTAFRNPSPLPIETRPIEAYRAASNVPAFYQPAPDDGSQPAIYYVNTYKAETRPLYNGEALCFHETVPGHHLQGSIAQRLSLPDFRRQMGQTAYVEGWALYSERLAGEMHLYSGDPARFGMLGYQAWRAARLVVDTGMHALRWDREKALEFLRAHTTLTQDEAANEIDRYLVMPGQALGYMVGESEIFRLRDMARQRLGDRFDVKDFHEVVLSHGGVPLAVLGRLVGEWLDRAAPKVAPR